MYVWFRNRTTACSMFQTTSTNCQQIQFTPSYLATDSMQIAHEPAGSCFTTFPTTFTSNTSDGRRTGWFKLDWHQRDLQRWNRSRSEVRMPIGQLRQHWLPRGSNDAGAAKSKYASGLLAQLNLAELIG